MINSYHCTFVSGCLSFYYNFIDWLEELTFIILTPDSIQDWMRMQTADPQVPTSQHLLVRVIMEH